MATLGDLKKRIISETLRDDLADTMAADLTGIIQRSIEYYADERWWFNEAYANLTCTPGSPVVFLPPDFRFLDQAWLRVGGTAYEIQQISSAALVDLNLSSVAQGQPTEGSIFQSQMSLWPTPNQAYVIRLVYVADVQPLIDFAADTSTNFWTNTGQDLIVAQSKIRLFRDFLSSGTQDPRLANAMQQEADAYTRLRSETNKRISTGRVRASW